MIVLGAGVIAGAGAAAAPGLCAFADGKGAVIGFGAAQHTPRAAGASEGVAVVGLVAADVAVGAIRAVDLAVVGLGAGELTRRGAARDPTVVGIRALKTAGAGAAGQVAVLAAGLPTASPVRGAGRTAAPTIRRAATAELVEAAATVPAGRSAVARAAAAVFAERRTANPVAAARRAARGIGPRIARARAESDTPAAHRPHEEQPRTGQLCPAHISQPRSPDP